MPERTPSAFALLREPDFRRAYSAGAISQLGDAFHFVAIMWFAVASAGALGVIAVRIAGSVPWLVFGLHAGLVADRWDRRRTMIVCDLVRCGVLVPVAIAGVTGTLPLWALVPAGFVLTTCQAYSTPAYGALVPSLAGRENVQQAAALTLGTSNVVGVAGLAFASALLAVMSVGSFFAIDAASFLASALLLSRVRRRPTEQPGVTGAPALREGFRSLRVRPGLGVGIAMLGIGVTVMTGVWTVGIAELAHSEIGAGAPGLALLLTATAVGEIAASAVLTKRAVSRKVFKSCLCWTLLFPGYLLLAFSESLPPAIAGTFVVGVAVGASFVLITAAAQESIRDEFLGRAMGVVSLGNFGTKPLGLIAIAPLYLVFGPTTMFVAGGIVVFVAAVAAASMVSGATRRAAMTPAWRRPLG